MKKKIVRPQRNKPDRDAAIRAAERRGYNRALDDIEKNGRLYVALLQKCRACIGLALHREMGFGAVRILKVLDRFHELMCTGDTPEKVVAQLKEETHLEIALADEEEIMEADAMGEIPEIDL